VRYVRREVDVAMCCLSADAVERGINEREIAPRKEDCKVVD